MYQTIKECAITIICKEGDVLSNKEIAEEVRKTMNSDTTHKCIAWYKNKINRGIIKVDKSRCKWLLKGKIKNNEIESENLDEKILMNEAENFVYHYEKARTGKYPIRVKDINGYDFESGDRHIEVKGKRRKGTTHLSLTSNETEVLIKDHFYWLYLVEGDFINDPNNIDIYEIPKDDLLAMSQLKIQARLTQLSNREKRNKKWKKDISILIKQ